MTQTFKSPTTGDKQMIARYVGGLHVNTPNDMLADKIRQLVSDAMTRENKRPAAGERTIQAWVNEALRVHERNRRLYNHVMQDR